MHPHRYVPPRRPRSRAAVASLVLGILSVPSTVAFGLLILLPAMGTVTGAHGLRVTHTHSLDGRTMALWGFWLNVACFLIQFGLLLLALIGTRVQN